MVQSIAVGGCGVHIGRLLSWAHSSIVPLGGFAYWQFQPSRSGVVYKNYATGDDLDCLCGDAFLNQVQVARCYCTDHVVVLSEANEHVWNISGKCVIGMVKHNVKGVHAHI